MEDNDERNSLIPLVASLILAALVVGLLIFYKPNKIADLDHGTEAQDSSETEDTPNPNIELDAEIVAAERRDNDYYVQVQTNGTFEGVCEFTIASLGDEQSLEHSTKLEPADRVSACESSFPLRGLNPGEHNVTVLVTAKNGSTKTVSKVVEIK